MSVGSNSFAPSKLRKPSEVPKFDNDSTSCFGRTEHIQGRPVGSVAARAQAWERCPQTGYVTIGSIRYGVRFASREVAPSRGAVGNQCEDVDCCCGVVHLAVGAPPSRIPLLPCAKNTHQAPVSDVSRDMKAAPPTPSSLRRRFLEKFGSSTSSNDGETSRLISQADSREDLSGATGGSSTGQSALDKLHKFRFGSSGSSEEKNPKKKRGSDKTEKLRELTDMLRGKPEKRKPPTSPPGRTTKHPSLRSLFGSTTSLTGPGKDSLTSTKGNHKRASSVSNVNATAHPPPKPSEPTPPDPPPHEPIIEDAPKTVLSPQSQRPIAARSASFSQVDYNSSDGKYSWKRGESSKGEAGGSRAMTFPRKGQVDAATSVSPPPERVIEETTSSTPSVDSAVGSDEGLGLGSSQFLSEPYKSSGARSLTYPLGRKGTFSDEIPFSSIDGNGLKSLQSQQSRELSDVKEEVISELSNDTASEFQTPLNTAREVNNHAQSESTDLHVTESDSCESHRGTMSASDAQRCHNEEMLRPLENLGREIDDLLTQETSSSPKKPEIFVTTWPKSGIFDETESSPQSTKKKLKLNCSVRLKDNRGNEAGEEEDKKDSREENCPQRWSAGTDYSQTTADWGSEPMSPEDTDQKPNWAKNLQNKLFCQSSDEKDEDGSPPKRNLSRNESFSDGESDQAERSPSVSLLQDGDRNCTPSPLFSPLFDLSDNEARTGKRPTHPPRRYSKRPLRGPYGQMLEAEMKKPELKVKKEDDLKFLEDYYLTVKPTSHDLVSRHGGPRPRANTAQSLEDYHHLRRGHGNNPRSSPRRKVSANIPYIASDPNPNVCHQRTTSSPSQLGICNADTQPSTTPSPARSTEASHELLAELLKGSSEKRFSPDTSPSQSTRSKDLRGHVVTELVNTESSYVESLQIITKKYLGPLKNGENADLVDASAVDEIFYQIPEILNHHEAFLDELKKRLDSWNPCQKVGDILLDVFTKQAVIETYTSYISNCKKASEKYKATCHQKPSFAKFIESAARDHRGKLTLDALLIMPVQRVPHYELLIQRLLKYTDTGHPDYALLQAAHREVHELAVKIDSSQMECLEFEQQQQTLRDLEAIIEGLDDLPTSERVFLRTDTVTMAAGQGARKERALFLFSDLMVIASIKRKGGPMKKPSTVSTGSGSGFSDTNKYKLLMRIPLDDLEIVKSKDEKVRNLLREMERLAEDAATLNQITDLISSLHIPHGALEDIARDLQLAVHRQLADRQSAESQLAFLELTLSRHVGSENISVMFSKTDKRASWEDSFTEAKQKLALSSEHRPCPEFVAPVPIRKTRAGLQFTCASPTLSLSPTSLKDVWVCNSDGYVGQVCVLSLQPEPTVISCNGVCNARILCVASVPAASSGDSSGGSNRTSGSSDTKSGTVSISVEDIEETGIDLELESSSSSSVSEDEDQLAGEKEMRRSKSEPLSGDSSTDGMDAQPAMWLGTEDGNIHVYNCSDNIRVKKNKVKIQHGSSVQCIIYLDRRVFVALANGDVTVYSRDRNGSWKTSEPVTVAVGTAAASVTRMVPVGGRLWCGCHGVIRILNTTCVQVEKSFPVSTDGSRMVSGMAVSGLGVWVALHNCAILRLFHATTYENLCEVSVAPAVNKMLAGCDDIIRQHKAACLRVTSLLACKELLWVGTSAGVVLTLPLPHVTQSTSRINHVPNVTGVPQGHTGHVRFLTCVEVASPAGDLSNRHRHSIKNKSELSTLSSGKVMVISGGDGYEDFRNANTSEVAGREDSTNHLLLWHI